MKKATEVIINKNGTIVNHQMPGMTCPVTRYEPTAATNPIIAARPLSFSAVSLNIIVTSEDTEKEFASDSVGKETRDDTHHRPATIVTLDAFHRGSKTLGVIVIDNHLRFFGPHVILTHFVSSNHCLL